MSRGPGAGPADPDSLYGRALAAWKQADWTTLGALTQNPLDDSPDRAHLALLVAAGLAQTGNFAAARQRAAQARDWGCSSGQIAEILIGGAYNSLGRAAVLLNDDAAALDFFGTALAVTGPGDVPRETGEVRKAREAVRLSAELRNENNADTRHRPKFSASGRDAFRAALPGWQDGRDLPYLIETKSLPRSGLHFMQSCFDAVLAGRFSFCEWYQEPGCCRRQPCSVARLALNDPRHPVHMVKSHDFALADHAYAPPPGVQRVILVRDPLMILTSWWALDELARHSDILATRGIGMPRLYFRHEKMLLNAANALVERHFKPVPENRLETWLAEKTSYITGFLHKWATVPEARTHVIRYDDLPAFVSGFFRDRTGALSDTETASAARLQAGRLAEFEPRGTPFASRVRQVTETLNEQAHLFHAAADKIRASDKTGLI